MFAVASIFAFVAAVDVALLLLMRPAVIARRGRNAWVGMRTPALMASDDAWVEGHRIAWPWVVAGTVAALVLIAIGLALLVQDPDSDLPFLMLILSAFAQAGPMITGAVLADRRVRGR